MAKRIVCGTSQVSKGRAGGFLVILAALLAGCAGAPEFPTAAEAPAAHPALLDRFEEVIVPDFAEAAVVPDLGLGRRIADYLAGEMRGVFKGRVTRRTPPDGPPGASSDRDLWRTAGAAAVSTAFLSGTARLAEQAQKALNEADIPKDGPFKLDGRGLLERKRFVLTIDFVLVEAATGEVVWKNVIQATWISSYAEETAEFALTDLLPTVKAKLFPALVRTPRPARGS